MTQENNKTFTVVLELSGLSFEIPPDKSILEVLEENDEGVPFSCRQGECATCVTGVISGIPDHRDIVLSDEEHAANNKMTICCSRALSDELVLEL